MSRTASHQSASKRRRGRSAPESSDNMLLAEFGWSELSWSIIGWTMLLSVIGLGPLLVATLIEASGVTLQILAALGPSLVCLAFAGLTWRYGMKHATEMGLLREHVWVLVAMFIGLSGLVGWGLFVSV